MTTFAGLDAYLAAPLSTFEFDPAAAAKAGVLLTAEPMALYRRLLRDQESEPVLLAARRVLHGFLTTRIQVDGRPAADAEQISARVERFREVIAAILEDLPAAAAPVRHTVLRQRAPLALIGGCWLDVVSQPATQPASIVNRLVQHQFVWQGRGNPRRGLHHLRRRALKAAGVYLPDILDADFMGHAEARPLTALHGAFYLSLAKLPANFLPEVIGVHYAVATVGVDDLMLGLPPMVPESELRALLSEYLSSVESTPEIGARVVNAVELALSLELEHVGMLAGMAACRSGRASAEAADRIGDREAAVWRGMLAIRPPADVVLRRADVPGDREFFHRLVNIENYPNSVDLAREHATVVMDVAEEVLFEHGGSGVLTDASWFDYSPYALRTRVDRICREVLPDVANPPRRMDVLAGMIAGAWAYRIGNVGRYVGRSDGQLYSIYADEVGRGDLGGNNIALTYEGLRGLGFQVPHIREIALVSQDDLPDYRYELAIQALCLSLSPDSFYAEILGFNLGITMLGLGRVDTPDLQRVCPQPERAAKSAEIIVGYLSDLASTRGPHAVRDHWRRIWRGYASFAFLVEPEPLGSVPGPAELTAWPLVPAHSEPAR